jgi:hypothetical protein
MQRKVILFSGLLLVLVIGTLLVASIYFISASGTTATAPSSQSESNAATPKVNGFAVWQEPHESNSGPVHARVEIAENASDPFYTHADGGIITLVRSSGDHILTSEVHSIDMVEECDPREGILRTRYAFEMLPATVAAALTEGEAVEGNMTLHVEGEQHVFPLPRREVSIHR